MSQHFKFLSANLQFLSRHLLEKPEMLLIGKDVTDASHLVRNVTQVFLFVPIVKNFLDYHYGSMIYVWGFPLVNRTVRCC